MMFYYSKSAKWSIEEGKKGGKIFPNRDDMELNFNLEQREEEEKQPTEYFLRSWQIMV